MQANKRKITRRSLFSPWKKAANLTFRLFITAPNRKSCTMFARNLLCGGNLNRVQKTRIARNTFFTGKARCKFKRALILFHHMNYR